MTGDMRETIEIVERIHNRIIQDYDIVENVMKNAGKYDGKYRTTVSLSTHQLNVLTTGINAYVFDELYVHQNDDIDKESIAVLSSGLLLHDLNKYMEGKTGETHKNNMDSLEKYLETDDFGLKTLFEDMDSNIEDYKEDILALVQRTEKGQNATQTRGSIRSKFENFPQYCEFADAVSSSISVDGLEEGSEKIRSRYPETYQEIDVNPIEYPIINQLILNSIKNAIESESVGFIIGSSRRKILYLGDDLVYEDIKNDIIENLNESVDKQFSFECKAKWNTYEYQGLVDVPLDISKKREAISDAWSELLMRDSGREKGLDSIPKNTENIMPELAKIIFDPEDGKTDLENDREEIYREYGLGDLYDTAVEDSSSPISLSIQLFHNTIREYSNYKTEIESMVDNFTELVSEDLTSDVNIFEDLTDRVIGSRESNESVSIGSSEGSCFLCGKPADRSYQAGDVSIFGTNSFSERTEPYQKYKKICSYCQIESALLDGFIKNSPEYLSNFQGSVLYIFSDDFVPDLKLDMNWKNSSIGGEVPSMYDDPDEWNIKRYGVVNQYEMIPASFTDSADRVRTLKSIFEFLSCTGVKAELSRPFSRPPVNDCVFLDTDPIRIEQTIGMDSITDFEGLERYVKLFGVIETLDVKKSRRYTAIKRDEYKHMVSTVVSESDIPVGQKDLNKVKEYVETYHSDEHMKMKQVAEKGIELYGKSFDSKYSKTQVFRKTLEEIIEALTMDLEDEELIEHVSGQVYALSDRQDYAGEVTTEQARDFTEAVLEYIEENGLMSLQDVSDKMNDLVNTYLFAYEEAMKETED